MSKLVVAVFMDFFLDAPPPLFIPSLTLGTIFDSPPKT